jgi:hypothetical protein
MAKERYQIKTACPQCGCSEVAFLSHEEMVEKYGDVPNIELSCSECTHKYDAKMETACPEWDEECKLKAQ